MIRVGDLVKKDRVISPRRAPCPEPDLSIVVLVDAAADARIPRTLIQSLRRGHPRVEAIVVLEGEAGSRAQLESFAQWCADEGCRAIVGAAPYHLPALRLNQGIAFARASRILLLDVGAGALMPDLDAITACVSEAPPDRVLVLIHPDDEPRMIAVPGALQTPWIDMLFKGYRFPLGNVIFPASAFHAHGLLDPHILVAANFDQEFLLRICRYLPFVKIVRPEADRGVHEARWSAVFHAWLDIDRHRLLQAAGIEDYVLDEVPSGDRALPASLAWSSYLDTVLTYYHDHSAYLPDGLYDAAHSLPIRVRHVLALKTNYYETLVDVGFRNYDLFAQGRSGFKSTYAYFLQMPAGMDQRYDALLLIRTIDLLTYQLASASLRGGPAVGYALDDDLIRMYEYEGEFAGFRPGHPAYEHMLRLLAVADVVLTSSDAIRDSVRPINPRLVHYEGSLLPEYLPDVPRERASRFRFGYAGGSYRRREMRMLWPAIERLCAEFGDRIEFQFWGLEARDLPGTLPHVSCRPFSTSYYEYLARLGAAQFDAMLVPLLSEPAPNRAKAPNKLYETVAAGAVGLFSNVPSYQVVARNDLGLVVDERWEAWYEAMRRVLEMSDAEQRHLRQRAAHFVRDFYTTGAMLPVHESSLAAITFHGATRAARDQDGRPIVLFVFPVMTGVGGGEILLRRRLTLVRNAGVAPVALLPAVTRGTEVFEKFCAEYLDPERVPYDFAWYRPYLLTPPREPVEAHPDEVASIVAVLAQRRPALVHSGGFIPAVGVACAQTGIPHVVSHYIVDDDYEWPRGKLGYRHCDLVQSDSIRYAKKWGALFECEWFCARDSVPEELFELGFARLYGAEADAGGGAGRPLRIGVVGTLIPRKSQLEVIRALRLCADRGQSCALDLWGSEETDPAYAAACRAEVERLGLQGRVHVHGHQTRVRDLYADSDVVVSASTAESFPNSIKEGTAAGALIVTTLAGGIGELIKDGMNGVVCSGASPEEIAAGILRAAALGDDARREMRRNAFSLARRQFHPRRALADLLNMYNQALDVRRRTPGADDGVHRDEPAATDGMTAQRSSGGPPLTAGRVSVLGTPGSPRRLSRASAYRVRVEGNGWSGLDVRLETQVRPAGGLTLRIVSVAGRLLREATVDLASVDDDGWAAFRFSKIENSGGMEFLVHLTLRERRRGARVSIVEARGQESRWGRRRAARAAGLPIARGRLYCRCRFA